MMIRKLFDSGLDSTIVQERNIRIGDQRNKFLDLRFWLNKQKSEYFILSYTFQFISILYYFGVVVLLRKCDYLQNGKDHSQHHHVHGLGMYHNSPTTGSSFCGATSISECILPMTYKGQRGKTNWMKMRQRNWPK